MLPLTDKEKNKIHDIVRKEISKWSQLKDDELTIKDCSKGCDNNVYVIKNNNSNERVVLRWPKELDSDFPMHTPIMQAEVSKVLKKHGLPVADLIALTKTYMIESYVEENDLSEIYQTPLDIPDGVVEHLFPKIGTILRGIHEIDTGGRYGYIQNTDLQGDMDHWHQMFNDTPMHLKGSYDNDLFDLSIIEGYESKDHLLTALTEYFESMISEIKETTIQPKLVHADLCSNNIRVKKINNNNIVDIVGIIDFADCLSGDGLYDIGRILSHCYCRWNFIEAIGKTYCDSGSFTKKQERFIMFYAFTFCSWLLEGSAGSEINITKYNTILNNLLKLMRGSVSPLIK